MSTVAATSQLGSTSEAARSNSGSIGLAENFDDFLKILLTQLKVQDPTQPMDTEAFTQQLVQFAEVEQSINQNKKLGNIEAILTKQSTVNTITSGAVDYVGKLVTVDDAVRNKTDSGAQWPYITDEKANMVAIGIFNEKGEKVLFKTEKITGGKNIFVWDGKDPFGQKVPNGKYRLEVRAFDKDAKEVPSSTDVQGTVKAVEFENGVMKLVMSNGTKLNLEDVKSVEIPPAETSNSGSSGNTNNNSNNNSSS